MSARMMTAPATALLFLLASTIVETTRLASLPLVKSTEQLRSGDQVSESMERPQRQLLGSKKRIMVDAGHGGRKPGAVANGFVEKELNLKTAELVREYLEARDFTVLMIRTDDEHVDVKDRAKMANEEEVDLFVSIHYNAEVPEAHGSLVLVDPSVEEGDLAEVCATAVLTQLGEKTKIKTGEVRSQVLAVLKRTRMAAILVEAGFLTSPIDSELLRDDETIDAIAKAIAAGVDECL
ncbi:hypothetical protein BSKO_02650 [Bryopsis sp. KO-2023]|nr:hypothetical protein BSKO_02650 [Bryopsis sp. KO-2023]